MLGQVRAMKISTCALFGICLVLLLAGCVTRGPKVLSAGRDAEIEAEALRIARADIAAGHPRVCYAGTIASGPVGIPAESSELVRDLQRFPLPCGCTDPLALPAEHFAQIYNREVLRYLQEHGRE